MASEILQIRRAQRHLRILGLRLWAVGATVAAFLPTGARAACEDMYANGVKPSVRGNPPPTSPLAATNIQVLCRRNRWNVPEFGAPDAGYFESAYNLSLGSPNYVAYCLDPTRSGQMIDEFWNDADFGTSYNPDPEVPLTHQPIRQFAFGSMILQFGHMAPKASMMQALDAASQANFLTNGAPMVRALNVGPWESLEQWVRTWAQDRAVYVLVGPIYDSFNPVKRVRAAPTGAIKVAIPDSFFAIIYQPSGAVGTNPMLLAYQFPNNQTHYNNKKRLRPQGTSGPPPLQFWLTTVNAIETATGFNFPLPGLPGVAAGTACGVAIP